MKFFFALFFVCCSVTSFGQTKKFDGIWEGKLNAGVTIRIVFEFKTNDAGVTTGFLTSPDQSSQSLPTDISTITGDSIFTKISKFGIQFSGHLKNDTLIDGIFVQGRNFPLELIKKDKVIQVKRPQTPTPPFDYQSNEVAFKSADNQISFAGTLTLPKHEETDKKTFPAVILISGSGPQDRDETIFQHKPFAVIADYLTKRGFAVLRFDERGVGKSTGNFATATSADFATDVEAALDFLKTNPKINIQKIGLIGHSEGGSIAPMVAAKRKDVKFIVLMAGPGVPTSQLMKEQIIAISEAHQISSSQANLLGNIAEVSMAITNKNLDSLEKDAYIEKYAWPIVNNQKLTADSLQLNSIESVKQLINAQLKEYTSPWFKYFLSIDPSIYLKKLSCNVLAINGSKDIQVLPTSNLNGIKNALKKNKSKRFNVEEIPGLNHLFQTCVECSETEYGQLEETFSPKALEIIGNWLEKEK